MIRILSQEERYSKYRPAIRLPAPKDDAAKVAMYGDCDDCGHAPDMVTRENTDPLSDRHYGRILMCPCKSGQPADNYREATANWKAESLLMQRFIRGLKTCFKRPPLLRLL